MVVGFVSLGAENVTDPLKFVATLSKRSRIVTVTVPGTPATIVVGNPVTWNCEVAAGVTWIGLSVPVRIPDVTTVVAVIDCMPAVVRITPLNVWRPASAVVNVYDPGRTVLAFVSLLVNV